MFRRNECTEGLHIPPENKCCLYREKRSTKKKPPNDYIFQTGNLEQVAQKNQSLLLFGWYNKQFAEKPSWHRNPFNNKEKIDPNLTWPKALKSLRGSDVKPYWEASRFDWVPKLASEALRGDASALDNINCWVDDWINKNPPFMGINWSCGQETSLRVVNLAMAQLILNKKIVPTKTLKWFLEVSYDRIQPTFQYAIGQDNNHGVSESCAIFIIGCWGKVLNLPNADLLQHFGRKWLEDRAQKIIQPDGSPAQYSTNYHRLNLELFCIAELFRSYSGEKEFSERFIKRIRLGASWLFHITNPKNGFAPNIGANDGSNLFNFRKSQHCDFRDTVSLCARIFDSANAYHEDVFIDKRAKDLHLPEAEKKWSNPKFKTYHNGGFHVAKLSENLVVLRYANFKFRPSQADILHIDLWVRGQNILRDSGTFTYETNSVWSEYFKSTSSHNTIQFDDREQMPSISKFLFGDWIKTDYIKPISEKNSALHFGAGYTDKKAASHQRDVVFKENKLVIKDRVSGFRHNAVLRWRFQPGSLKINEKSNKEFELRVKGKEKLKMNISSTIPFSAVEISKGWESQFYLLKTELPVLKKLK